MRFAAFISLFDSYRNCIESRRTVVWSFWWSVSQDSCEPLVVIGVSISSARRMYIGLTALHGEGAFVPLRCAPDSLSFDTATYCKSRWPCWAHPRPTCLCCRWDRGSLAAFDRLENVILSIDLLIAAALWWDRSHGPQCILRCNFFQKQHPTMETLPARRGSVLTLEKIKNQVKVTHDFETTINKVLVLTGTNEWHFAFIRQTNNQVKGFSLLLFDSKSLDY